MPIIPKIRTAISRRIVLPAMHFWFGKVYGMDIGQGVRISRHARLDRTNPKGVHIGDHTAITAGVSIITHDFVNREWKDVYIGKNCFLGYGAVVLPGVSISDNCIVAANSVVARDVEANSVVMGNPARVVERNILTGPWGIRLDKGKAKPVVF
jgi:acetyltransferase-like isoleucine patch superfamily enzyme